MKFGMKFVHDVCSGESRYAVVRQNDNGTTEEISRLMDSEGRFIGYVVAKMIKGSVSMDAYYEDPTLITDWQQMSDELNAWKAEG